MANITKKTETQIHCEILEGFLKSFEDTQGHNASCSVAFDAMFHYMNSLDLFKGLPPKQVVASWEDLMDLMIEHAERPPLFFAFTQCIENGLSDFEAYRLYCYENDLYVAEFVKEPIEE